MLSSLCLCCLIGYGPYFVHIVYAIVGNRASGTRKWTHMGLLENIRNICMLSMYMYMYT